MRPSAGPSAKLRGLRRQLRGILLHSLQLWHSLGFRVCHSGIAFCILRVLNLSKEEKICFFDAIPTVNEATSGTMMEFGRRSSTVRSAACAVLVAVRTTSTAMPAVPAIPQRSKTPTPVWRTP